MATCTICGTTEALFFGRRVLAADILHKAHKGESAILCPSCISAHSTLTSKEYRHKKYGEPAPVDEDAGRKGCPLCTIMCHECPYKEEE